MVEEGAERMREEWGGGGGRGEEGGEEEGKGGRGDRERREERRGVGRGEGTWYIFSSHLMGRLCILLH